MALYLYRFGPKGLPLSIDDIGGKFGMGSASLKYRIKTFQLLGGGKGLDHWAKQSECVYGLYKDAPQEELKPLVLRALAKS